MKKKLWLVAAGALVLLLGVFCLLFFEGGLFHPCSRRHAAGADEPASLYWHIDGAGTLTVGGSKNIPNFFIREEIGEQYDKTYPLHAEPKKIVRKIVIEEGITGIGDYAFSNLPRVREIVLPDSVTSIGKDAFANSGIESVCIPAGVASFSGSAFGHCKKLTDVQLADGNAAFVLEGGVLLTADKSELVAYFGNKAETDFTVPGSVTVLAERCFSDAVYLTRITVPEGVSEIGEAAFQYCDALKEVALPGSLEHIAQDVFEECPALHYVAFGGSEARWNALAPELPDAVSVTFAGTD